MSFSKDSLKTIHLVAHSGSFAVAAEILNRVPSAISYTVKKLEEELGFDLFDRAGRQVKLTEAGAYFIQKTTWILDSYEGLVQHCKMINEGVDSSFSIAINNIIRTKHLPRFMTFLTEHFSSTQFTLTTEVYNGCWDALYAQRADIVIGAPHTPPKLEGIIYESIGDIEWDFVVGANHPLAQYNTLLDAEILRTFPAIVVKDTAIHLPPQNTWSLTGQKVIYTSDLITAIDLLIAGVGIGYVPHHLVVAHLNDGRLLKKPIAEHKQPSQLFYAWQTQKESPVLKACIAFLLENKHNLNWQG